MCSTCEETVLRLSCSFRRLPGWDRQPVPCGPVQVPPLATNPVADTCTWPRLAPVSEQGFDWFSKE
jgi:hypothetical protein